MPASQSEQTKRHFDTMNKHEIIALVRLQVINNTTSFVGNFNFKKLLSLNSYFNFAVQNIALAVKMNV